MLKNSNQDSLKKRYLFKLFSNIVCGLVRFIILAIVPKNLGPVMYGNFSFLTNYFHKVVGFLDFGSSMAFFIKLSQKDHDTDLIPFYLRFMSALFLLLTVSVCICIALGFKDFLWPDQKLVYIYAGLVFAFLNWMCLLTFKTTDALGITTKSESVRTVIRVMSLAAVILLFKFNLLNLDSYFALNHLVMLIIVLLVFARLVGAKQLNLKDIFFMKSKDSFSNFISYFRSFCTPLVKFNLIMMVIGVADYWLLQKFSGSKHQGFFGLSSQISLICFLFASSMTPLFSRELSKSFSENNKKRMKDLYDSIAPMLFSVTAYFSVFLLFHTELLVRFFGGAEYTEARIAIMIMILYPVHQCLGQINTSVFYSMGNTEFVKNIGVAAALTGLPVTLFFLAPESLHGLNLGATGLAAKTVLVQFIAVNVQLFYCSKELEFRFIKHFTIQFSSLATLCLAAWLSITATAKHFSTGNPILFFLTSGIVYSLLTGLAGYFLPVLFGAKKELIKEKFFSWTN